MKTLNRFQILAGVACVLSLAACDSIKDVPNEDAASLPPQTVVLSGQINGLSSLRAITLQNNDDAVATRSVINAAPTVPNEGVRPVPFSFGALPAGSPYKITVKQQPEFKHCEVVNGEGVLTVGVAPNIVINCANTATRYDLSVHIPSDPSFFKGLEGAKVRVTTEEEIREIAVTAATPSPVVFEDVLINATGTLNAATWSVTASTFEGNRLNKCVVTFPNGSNSTGNVATPVVGAVAGVAVDATAPACAFTVGGRVGYSLPPGETTAPNIAGLKLQLRDLQLNALETLDVATCTTANAGVTQQTLTTALNAVVPVPVNTTCAYQFNTPVRSSSTSGVYEVAVAEHPAGQFCVVTNGGMVSVFTQGLTSPVSVTNANVFCRATPPANRQLTGVYRLRSTTFVPNAITNAAPRTSTWEPFDFSKQNTASSNMMAFFDNGTFLYGAHGNGAQAEHGFYDYDPTAQTLRFTSIVDTNTSTTFPANFSPVQTTSPTATTPTSITHITTTTPGISALPNPIRRNGATLVAQTAATPSFAASHAAMTGVTLGTVQVPLDEGVTTARTISGTFGADPAGLATAQFPASCSAAAPCINSVTGAAVTSLPAGQTCATATPVCYSPSYAYRVSWVLEEPPQVQNQMTGAWTTQDSRRLWVWDYRTYYGTSVAMMGGSPSMNDACFTMENLHASSGTYTRRGTGTGCFPFARPGNDPQTGQPGISTFSFATFTFTITPRNGPLPAYSVTGAESVDLTIAPSITSPIIPQLPGYTGRHPGGEPAPSTESPSPVYFQIAPAASFFTEANATYFPPVSTDWCTTEILGLRATANGFPINYPLYFCRTQLSN
ncbi:MAG TPA: hypothetical protein VNQ32_12215 [Steroidobacteraceae bacterium]|nr:hypothetical protein [Steroidobacteraceae bacterium]